MDGNLDISEYTDKEGQKRITFRILADTYRSLQTQKGEAEQPPPTSFLAGPTHPLLNTNKLSDAKSLLSIR